MKNIVTTASLLLASSLALVIGCTSPQIPWYGKGPTEQEPEVAEAERLFEQGYLRSFIVASVAPSTNAAANAGLQDLQNRIARRLSPEVLEAERLFETGKRQEALAACNALGAKRPDAVGLAQLRTRMTRDLAPAVAAAEELFAAGKTQEAISACIDITRKDPEAVGLADLQRRINLRLAEERLAAANKLAEATVDLSSADALGFASMPQRYRQRQHVMGETNVVVTPLTGMQKALQEPISLTLDNADVNAIIAEIKKSTNINYIADSEIVSTKITARFENTRYRDAGVLRQKPRHQFLGLQQPGLDHPERAACGRHPPHEDPRLPAAQRVGRL